MLTISKILTLTLTMVLILTMGTVSFAAESSSELTKMNLKVCNVENSRCLSMKADKGIGSSIAPIHSLEKISLVLINKLTNQETNFSSDQGYWDMDYNRIVLTTPLKMGIKETIFDFKDLEPKFAVMK